MLAMQATPESTARLICDRVEPLLSDSRAIFFEPGCGDGSFLAEVLKRRLDKLPSNLAPVALQNQVLITVSRIYAIEISPALLSAARRRLFKMATEFLGEDFIPDYRFSPLLDQILSCNFLLADFLDSQAKIVFLSWKYKADFDFVSEPMLLMRGHK